ncbi:MAG: phosphatidylserine/phosphatidylglycerophosphate/cardiolipin synthase family protein [Actinomycetota bacterium]|nr:phosphatidylserine/phosphatidylglycerophosphate/cardiolipin synthase family protein [Actinomycetota bacterium]
MIELRTYRDGGQSAVDVANEVAEFLGAAAQSLELALYDVRLHDDAAAIVKDALLGAHERGVTVRLVYNVDHPGPIPVPPPPQTAPELLEALPIPTRPVAGVPDLMHHKYVVRDRDTVWTGSMNWTQDSWSRQENAIAIVRSPELAHAYALNFEQLWEDGSVLGGTVDPRPVDVGGVEIRPWFTPDHGEALAHRIAKRIGQAKRRIRIASPVLSSGPILGTLAEVCSDGKVDVAGVVDDTQVDGVLYQWRLNGNSSWKVPALRRFLEAAQFAGKPSTTWAPDTVHDFMHAKITVADDISFIGSFNLSHSGESNAENVLEIKDAGIADRLAAFVDEIRALYPLVTLPVDKTQAPAASPLL